MLLLALLACGGAASKDSGAAPFTTTPTAGTSAGTPAGTGGGTGGTTDCVDADGDGVDTCSGDCDDTDPLRFPGAVEQCDGVDNDCDGTLAFDEGTLGGDGLPVCAACDASGFWLPTRDLAGDALWAALPAVTDAHDCRSYSEAKDYLWSVLGAEGGIVTCVYTGDTVAAAEDVPAGFSTEHSWPRSLGADSAPEECDLHHLFPTAEDANGARANVPFGEVTGDVDWSRGGSMLGGGDRGATVFEPRDGHKGDAARAMLYFAARYGHDLPDDELALYQRWHAAEPPDAADVERSNRVAFKQGAGNPFVVCPELVDAL